MLMGYLHEHRLVLCRVSRVCLCGVDYGGLEKPVAARPDGCDLGGVEAPEVGGSDGGLDERVVAGNCGGGVRVVHERESQEAAAAVRIGRL